MKRNLKFLIAFGAFVCFTALQTLYASGPRAQAQFSFSYQFQSSEGTNASAVVWVPNGGFYMTCIAGNETFPLEAFSAKGENLYSGEVGIDIRGMWYNPKTEHIEANAVGENGWFETAISSKGKPAGDWKQIVNGQFQPDFQSVLSYIPSKKKLVTFYDNNFSYWGRKNHKEKLRFQHATPFEAKWEINPTTACYTGNKDFPIALLELNEGKLLYFDLKGKYLGETVFPDGTFSIEAFRFSFANGLAFLYDSYTRTWNAYQVFE